MADYQASGGIRNALTQTAEQAEESLTGGQRRLARQLFLRLVHVADGVPPSRAWVALGDLADRDQAGDAEAVLATFVGERMITVDANAAQITHDALLTAWPRLRAWIEENTQELRDRDRIAEGARAWAEAGQEEDALWRGSRLALAREWAADPAKRAALSGAGALVRGRVGGGRGRQRARGPAADPLAAVHRRRADHPGARRRRAFRLRLQPAVGGPRSRGHGAARGQHGDSRDVAFTADQLRSQDPAVAASSA